MAEKPARLDRIHIRDLRLRCIVGIHPHERTSKQEVVVSLTLSADLRGAGRSDRIEETIDYEATRRKVVDLVAGSSFRLVEALAEAIAQTCLSDRRVRRARVLVEKPAALDGVRTVGVEIVREQPDGAG